MTAPPAREAASDSGPKMKLAKAAAAAILAMTTPAAAADLFAPAPAFAYPASEAPTAVEVGTNWYVRGDLGASFSDAPKITLPLLSASPATFGATTTWSSNQSSTVGFAGGLGFGYRANNYVRLDATWTYWAGVNRTRTFDAGCPLPANNPYQWGNAPGTYVWDTSTGCTDSVSLRQHNNTFLGNVYADLGTYYQFTPYVGAGAGANMHTMTGAGTFIDPGNSVPYWSRTINTTTWRFAWSLTAGLSFQLTPSFALDVGYHYINGGDSSLLINPMTGLSVKQTNATQLVTIGLRWIPQ